MLVTFLPIKKCRLNEETTHLTQFFQIHRSARLSHIFLHVLHIYILLYVSPGDTQ